MAKKQQAETPKEPQTDTNPPEGPKQAETARQVYRDGQRTYLYHADAPQGRVFEGAAANQALADGWVDSPAKLDENAKK